MFKGTVHVFCDWQPERIEVRRDRRAWSSPGHTLGPLLSLNAERSMKHWKARAGVMTRWVCAGYWHAADAGWPTGLERITCVVRPVYKHNRFTDTGNIYPAQKALIDGFVEYGLIPDDNRYHLAETRQLAAVRGLADGMLVQVIEMPAEPHHQTPCSCAPKKLRGLAEAFAVPQGVLDVTDARGQHPASLETRSVPAGERNRQEPNADRD